MPCPFTGHKMFCTGQIFLSQPKNLTTFSASSKTFVPAQKPILLNANYLFVWHKMFVTATICKWFFVPQKIWTSPKYFETCKRTRYRSWMNWKNNGPSSSFVENLRKKSHYEVNWPLDESPTKPDRLSKWKELMKSCVETKIWMKKPLVN